MNLSPGAESFKFKLWGDQNVEFNVSRIGERQIQAFGEPKRLNLMPCKPGERQIQAFGGPKVPGLGSVKFKAPESKNLGFDAFQAWRVSNSRFREAKCLNLMLSSPGERQIQAWGVKRSNLMFPGLESIKFKLSGAQKVEFDVFQVWRASNSTCWGLKSSNFYGPRSLAFASRPATFLA